MKDLYVLCLNVLYMHAGIRFFQTHIVYFALYPNKSQHDFKTVFFRFFAILDVILEWLCHV